MHIIVHPFSSLRFTAVCNPYKYRENNVNANITQSIFKFLVLIIIFSVLLNIPRFFKTEILTSNGIIASDGNITYLVETVSYDVTPLRMDPKYIWYKGIIFSHS